ncbi:MAG TPA: PH domain-containing protein [Thermomicrobiales bacterium]|nr:PH domain-containing protein [Thermomicrobiales bacterium]
MSQAQPSTLVDGQIIDALDVTPRRLSKLSLYWYLKALPELTVGTVLTIIPLAVGAVLSLILLIDWGIRRAFSQTQIEEALNYDFESIDDAKLQEWIESPQLADWISGLSIWVFVVPVLVAVGLIVGWFVMRTLQWRRIRFGIEDGVIWTSGGLFTSWTRRLPIVHVQSVEFRSTLLQRILTLRGVAVSSAAPEGKNATIELLAIRRGVATELANTIQTAFGATIATPEAEDSGSVPIASVGWKQLIVAAANSFEVRLSVFSLYVFYRALGQVKDLKRWRDQAIHSVTKYAEQHHDLANLLVILIGALLFFWIFSILIYIATFARFRLRRNGKLALIEHGLLTRRWRTVLLPRIQALTFVESPAQQLVNDGSLRMTLPGTTRDELARTMLLPAVDRTVTIDVLNRLFAELNPQTGDALRADEMKLERLPPSARRSYLLRWTWRLLPLSLVIMLVLYLVPGGINPLWGLLPWAIFGPIGAWLGNIRFEDAGWRLDRRGRLVVRERSLSRTTRMTRQDRLVWTRVSKLRIVSGRNVTFVASVAGAGSRPGIKARLLGYGLVARGDSRLRVRGLLHEDALALVDDLAKRSPTRS